ncbi:MAG: alpha/beta hydrolase [Anaerolineales bacterium]
MPSFRSRTVRFAIRNSNFMNGKSGTIAEQRGMTDVAARLLRTPGGVAIQKARAGTVPGEWIVPKDSPADRALLYMHGGGFIFGSLATHRALIARLADSAGIRAFSVEYRLAPEHPFPAALDDSLEAYRGLVQDGITPDKIIVAGDSAGGNLALALILSLKKAGDALPAAAVCISPVTDMLWTGSSMRTKAGVDPIFPEGGSSPMGTSIHADYIRSADPRDPLISPLYGDMRGMPPVLLHVGEDEVLLDDSARLAERVRAAGGHAELVVWSGMWHVFQVFAPFVPEAAQSIRQMGEFIRTLH